MDDTIAFDDAWEFVDDTEDPAAFVERLTISRAPLRLLARADPAKFFAYLDVSAGMRVLDAGCGTADLLGPLSTLIGPSGAVVGVDSSAAMIAAASARAASFDPAPRIARADARAMPFRSGSFDRTIVTTVLQHLRTPHDVVAEAARVTAPGGLVVVTDTDWETFVVASSYRDVTRAIARTYCDAVPSGWVGRDLYGLLSGAGLSDLAVTPIVLAHTDFDPVRTPDLCARLERRAARAVASGAITQEAASAWLEDLLERGRRKAFFSGVTTFRVTGRVAG